MKKVLVIYAIDEEFVPFSLAGCELRFVKSGIGKAASAMNLTKAICEERPDFVLNFGTAGTLNHQVGDVFVCNRFVDRDFQAIHFPGLTYEIEVEETFCRYISQIWSLSDNHWGICNTGDSFVTQAETIHGDVVDMEAFAHALVCQEFKLPFVAVKYVTDKIGENSVNHWADKLADARATFIQWFERK